ncbi:alpha/beta hydrolase fold protein [alpha proteobacterium BAL199]|jgi:pimeloyl-ACP methyl ester carboxylesterase|nr:alpha/beta hydrolase fold protein [alpha proteobacterium BAL199]
MPAAPHERFVTNRKGRRIFVADWGDPLDPRLPLLGLPGFARTAKDFAHIADRLAPRRLISLDYRGRGRSERESDWRAYDPRTLVADIQQVAIATGLHRFIAVGTSLGGILAMALAVVMPGALAGVVLNDVGPAAVPQGASYLIDYMGRDRPQSDWPDAIAELRQMIPDLSLRTDEEWLAFAQNTFRRGDDGLLHVHWDPAVVKPLQHGTARATDLWPLFRALRPIPVLAIRGAVSMLLSAETFEQMGQIHPRMRQVTLDGVGHAPTLGEPPLTKALDDFLADV